MHAERIGEWLSDSALKIYLTDEGMLDWLHEEGSITHRISSKANFKLEIINDCMGQAEPSEYTALNIDSQTVRIREVLLYGNNKPLVYAKSIIPLLTSSKGYTGLQKIGNKPLGDLIFKSALFVQTDRLFAEFKTEHGNTVWGRKTHYSIKGYPMSIMEVFISQ